MIKYKITKFTCLYCKKRITYLRVKSFRKFCSSFCCGQYYYKNRILLNKCKDCNKKINDGATRCKHCANVYLAKTNINYGFRNTHHSVITRHKISIAKMGDKNPMWKGDEQEIHWWIKHRKPKTEFCEKCHINKPNDLANISGEYRRDVNDFEWLCRKCHMESDGRMFNRGSNGKFKCKK